MHGSCNHAVDADGACVRAPMATVSPQPERIAADARKPGASHRRGIRSTTAASLPAGVRAVRADPSPDRRVDARVHPWNPAGPLPAQSLDSEPVRRADADVWHAGPVSGHTPRAPSLAQYRERPGVFGG